MTNFTATLDLTAEGRLSAGVNPDATPSSEIAADLSGIVVNQNQAKTGYLDVSDSWIYQEFRFPADYPRGTHEQRIPGLSGLQIYVGIEPDTIAEAGLDWRFDHFDPAYGWRSFNEGVALGAVTEEDETWFNIFFEPRAIDSIWTHKWRFGIKGRLPGTLNQLVEYTADHKLLIIDTYPFPITPEISPVPLEEGKTYPFDYNGVPAIIQVGSGGQVFFSAQQGVTKVWGTSPNPLAQIDCRAYGSDGTSPLNVMGQETSLLFRILSGTADSGKDFLGNNYRSFVLRSDESALDPTDRNGFNKYWLSKPNPTKFAVESLYFDIRHTKRVTHGAGSTLTKVPSVIDQILLDPVTPGVFFNVYWSRADHPGHNEDEWDHHKWHPIYHRFQMTNREVHDLPWPITANFIKIEFTHLQPRYYRPGNFQKKMSYKRFPKWVDNHYGGLFELLKARQIIADSVSVTYDALDLLYGRFTGDLLGGPEPARTILDTTAADQLNSFIRTDRGADQADTQTLSQIDGRFQLFLDQPFTLGRTGDILFDQAATSATSHDYSTERSIRPAFDAGGEVGSEDFDGLLRERTFPVERFFITCRHYYKKVVAAYTQDNAYFAGVREVAFLRRQTNADTKNGNRWTLGDTTNIQSLDLETITDGTEDYIGAWNNTDGNNPEN